MSVRLGINAKIYRNTGTFGSPSWDEIKNVKDVTLNLEADEEEVTTRGSGGWKEFEQTLKDASIEFDMRADDTDADFTALKNAWANRATIELMALDGDEATTGTQGLRAEMRVISMTRSEPLGGHLSYSFTIKPAVNANAAPSWVVRS